MFIIDDVIMSYDTITKGLAMVESIVTRIVTGKLATKKMMGGKQGYR